ncbi:predicted protein [Lichtheimia corymbifera JMRC:FSU:9682]|uniref:Uncharacterized protein n=1 Tax=Lichtheimia corymbifera JMRC:FSU:9682 TaxID=1263082 RepID=A0A068RUR6_9FUNG|nr:predicted protein [Lichtheimia corymbifera JMRC:FSU:9682]
MPLSPAGSFILTRGRCFTRSLLSTFAVYDIKSLLLFVALLLVLIVTFGPPNSTVNPACDTFTSYGWMRKATSVQEEAGNPIVDGFTTSEITTFEMLGYIPQPYAAIQAAISQAHEKTAYSCFSSLGNCFTIPSPPSPNISHHPNIYHHRSNEHQIRRYRYQNNPKRH